MSSTSPPAFEHLPAEIHGNILRQMASPEDVYSTIRASPKALGGFLCFREDILIQVLQAHLPAEIFAEYLGLLHTPKYEDFNHVANRSELSAAVQSKLSTVVHRDGESSKDWEPEACKYQAWAKVVDSFFQAHFKNVNTARLRDVQAYKQPKTSEKAEINYIISTYRMLKRFIAQYQVFVKRNMTEYCPPRLDFVPYIREAELSQGSRWSPLSEREALRLHRGFLRYELCCRLNTIPDRNGAMLQCWRFGWYFFKNISDYLYDWEEEEIQCVWEYVAKQYQGVARDVVEDFCCDVWRLSRNARHVPDSEITLAPDLTPGKTNSYGFQSWECSMSYLGLPLLQQVLQSGVNEQRRFLKNTNLRRLPPYWGFPFLGDESNGGCIRHHRANHIYNSVALTLSRLENGRGSRQHAGWMYSEDYEDIKVGLRQTGWVFWEDRNRVEYFAIPGHGVQFYNIHEYITSLSHREGLAQDGLGRMLMSARYLEETMYVTQEDHQELVNRYIAKPVEPDAEHFLLCRLRAISDWSSKEVSPAFQDICSVAHATE